MNIACPKCAHEVDPNDPSLNWHPPSDSARSLGAIECPNCGEQGDFHEWKMLTGARHAHAD